MIECFGKNSGTFKFLRGEMIEPINHIMVDLSVFEMLYHQQHPRLIYKEDVNDDCWGFEQKSLMSFSYSCIIKSSNNILQHLIDELNNSDRELLKLFEEYLTVIGKILNNRVSLNRHIPITEEEIERIYELEDNRISHIRINLVDSFDNESPIEREKRILRENLRIFRTTGIENVDREEIRNAEQERKEFVRERITQRREERNNCVWDEERMMREHVLLEHQLIDEQFENSLNSKFSIIPGTECTNKETPIFWNSTCDLSLVMIRRQSKTIPSESLCYGFDDLIECLTPEGENKNIYRYKICDKDGVFHPLPAEESLS